MNDNDRRLYLVCSDIGRRVMETAKRQKAAAERAEANRPIQANERQISLIRDIATALDQAMRRKKTKDL